MPTGEIFPTALGDARFASPPRRPNRRHRRRREGFRPLDNRYPQQTRASGFNSRRLARRGACAQAIAQLCGALMITTPSVIKRVKPPTQGGVRSGNVGALRPRAHRVTSARARPPKSRAITPPSTPAVAPAGGRGREPLAIGLASAARRAFGGLKTPAAALPRSVGAQAPPLP